jgi:hypothetical protein
VLDSLGLPRFSALSDYRYPAAADPSQRRKKVRVKQNRGTKGSLKQIQRLANHHPELVADELRALVDGTDKVAWLSPLEADDLAEYRDQSALDLLEVATPKRKLSDFWPSRGPQWDGLIRVGESPVLIEAKAHIPELFSGACQAKSPRSREKIRQAMDETQKWLKARPGLDWMERFYQYTNRLAHLYFLRKVNGLDAHLVFLYFVGDRDMKGPTDPREWEAATAVLHEALGIRGRKVPGMHHLYVDVAEIEAGP